jgi:hypothetical protein
MFGIPVIQWGLLKIENGVPPGTCQVSSLWRRWLRAGLDLYSSFIWNGGQIGGRIVHLLSYASCLRSAQHNASTILRTCTSVKNSLCYPTIYTKILTLNFGLCGSFSQRKPQTDITIVDSPSTRLRGDAVKLHGRPSISQVEPRPISCWSCAKRV